MPSEIEVNQGQGLNYVENEIFWIFETFWDFLTFCKTISRIFNKNQNIKKIPKLKEKNSSFGRISPERPSGVIKKPGLTSSQQELKETNVPTTRMKKWQTSPQ